MAVSESKQITRLVRLSSATIGAIIATHTCLETARDTIFLQRVPVEHLPWMYVAVALLSLGTALAPTFRGPRGGAVLPLFLALCGAGTFVFWVLARSPTRPLLYALYLWTAFAGGTVVAQFWTSMARLFTVGESRRVFTTIAIGATAGSVFGAAIARALFLVAGPRALVLFAAVGFVGSAGLAHLLREAPSRDGGSFPKIKDQLPAARVVWKSSYLLTIGQVSVAMAITATTLDYAFKRAIVRHFHPAELGSVVSTVALATNVLGGLVQVFFVPRILSAFGTARALRLLPSALVMGAFAGVVMPFTLVAVGLHIIDGVLRYSLQRTATELLYVPISPAIRGRVKTMLDVVSQRAGQAVASLALLAIPVSMHTRFLVLAVALCAAVWFWFAVRLQPQYLALFRGMVLEGALKPIEGVPTLDQAAIEALVAALSSERDEEVILALDLLARGGKAKLIPSFILFHPTPRVVIHALRVLTEHGRKDAAPLAWRLLSHPDSDVRTEAVHAVAALDFQADRLRVAMGHGDQRFATTALVELWARGAEREEEVRVVDELLSPRGDATAQRSLLQALATTRSRRLLLAALRLAEGATSAVQIDIAKALELDPIPEGMPLLLSMLEHWSTRESARRAMVALGDVALAALVSAVKDEKAPPFVRAHAPRSISRFPPEAAVPLLVDLLLHHPEGVVRFKALRGLGRLATNGATIQIKDEALRQVVEREIAWTARALTWMDRLRRTPIPQRKKSAAARTLLLDLLREKGSNAGERLFRIIALRYRGEDWERIFDGFRRGLWDASRELVEGVLEQPLRGQVTGLVDRLGEYARAPPPTSYDEPLDPLLTELASAGDRVIAVVSAHYANTMTAEREPGATGVMDAVSSAH
jgi:AAA family ATP:ADP antiporter